MAEFIEKSRVIHDIKGVELRAGMNDPILMSDIYKAVEAIPAEDVRAVSRGHWLEVDGCMAICSECGAFGCKTAYCPECGVYMGLFSREVK